MKFTLLVLVFAAVAYAANVEYLSEDEIAECYDVCNELEGYFGHEGQELCFYTCNKGILEE
jgi:hypothetical protein